MPRRTLQRIVRISPDTARLAWGALPGGAKAALSTLVHPIASGDRQGAEPLSVARPAKPALYDVVVASGARLSARARNELAARGHRVLDAEPGGFRSLAERERVLDAVLLTAREAATENRASALGWRVAHDARALRSSFPEVTVVVATHAARELCESCLNSILRNTAWGNYRIVVVDDASRDGTREMLRALARSEPRLSLVRFERPRGFPGACNAGLSRASGEYVVFLNDDTVVAPGWLSRLVAHLERDRDLAMVCPVTNQIGNEAKVEVRYDSLDAMEALARERAIERGGELTLVPTLALFCVAVRLDLLRSVGGLDERYQLGLFEDDDLSMTLRGRGHTLAVAQDAFVHHVGQATFGKLGDERYLALWEENKRRFEEKWGVSWKPPPR